MVTFAPSKETSISDARNSVFDRTYWGALIGAERQWRQRAAGLRTNALVCLCAADFVDLGLTLVAPGTTGVIAYVVSGVGFLGAGAIKDAANSAKLVRL